jgi:transcriptional regulator with XRE-family HTH domain
MSADHEARELGRRLRLARERAGLSVYELARAADLSPPTVYQVEAGSRDPAWSTVVRLADALGLAVGDLAPGRD